MKSYIRPTFSQRERQIIAEEIDKATQRGICRAQWIMLIALNDVLGIGPVRIQRVLRAYPQLLREYDGYAHDGVEEDMLKRRLRQIGLDVERLWE